MCAPHCLGGDCYEVPSYPTFRVVLQNRFRVSTRMMTPHRTKWCRIVGLMVQTCLSNGAELLGPMVLTSLLDELLLKRQEQPTYNCCKL